MIKDEQKQTSKKGLTRRGFLKASAALGATTLALPGCTNAFKPASTNEAVEKTEDGVKVVRTVCAPNCVNSCAHNVFVKDEKIIKIEPGEYPDPEYRRICLKGIANAMQRVYSPDRVKYPMKRAGERGEDKWEQISWDQAYNEITEKHKEIADKYGMEANSWMGMTGNYGINAQLISARIANTVGGTHIDNLGIMGDLATNIAYLPMLGVLQEGHGWKDLRGSKLLIFFGCNYTEASLNDSHFLSDAKEAGAKLVVVDPRFTRTAAKADWWIPIRPGTDAAMALGMMHVIFKENLQKDDYIRQYTTGPFLVRQDTGKLILAKDLGGSGDRCMVWDTAAGKAVPADETPLAALTGIYEVAIGGQTVKCTPSHQLLLDLIEEYTPEKASEICEVPAEDIRKLALMYGQTDPAAIRMTQGIQRYYQGHLSCRALITLGAITGNIGKRHAGVSWAGGTLFKLIAGVPGDWAAPNPNVQGKKIPGTQLYDVIPSEKPYPIKSLWLSSYGMGTQAPLRDRLINEVFPALDLIVVSEQIMTPMTKYADYVLPVTSYYEEECDVVGAWSNLYIQFRKQAIKPLWEAKADWDCFAEYAKRMGFGEYWTMTQQESAEFIVKNSPDPIISGTNLEELKNKGVAWANQPADFVPFEDKKFNTAHGKIEIYLDFLTEFGEALPVYKEPLESNRTPLARKYPLTFMNARSVFTTHSQHVNLPWINEVYPEPRLEISPVDAKARNLRDGDLVEVANDRGKFKVKIQVTEGIKPGCLNICQGWWPKHFPEGHYASLLHMELNPAQDAVLETNFAPYDNLVEIKKA
ncbi:molybdopterin-dependent oxidoreductase [Desulfitobacterium sp. PCE1]|uniref:molybdopterin-dependent oxidoreductase n=1 Tax=Desulfitobacterium sp. PCE1 TaxID=146907 RepID=UPI0003689856|nr:molybdopterin-dependent oxidoreductase [Desulfitobacterium sp. PCE1]